MKRSKVTGRIYNELECVHIINPVQSFEYINHDATLYDVFTGSDRKLVFVFNRVEVQPLYDLWCKHELH